MLETDAMAGCFSIAGFETPARRTTVRIDS